MDSQEYFESNYRSLLVGDVDRYMFDDEIECITQSMVYSFPNSLILTHKNPMNFTIVTNYFTPYVYRTLNLGGIDRTFEVDVSIASIHPQGNLIRVEVELVNPRVISKDFDVWAEYTNAEKRDYVTCKGLDKLKDQYKHRCAGITKDSSGHCEFCFRVMIAEEYNDDCEPDVDETDWAAEDEALYYERLDTDMAIARGEIPV